ncbi:MAG: nicotinate-nucleotide adenylyltransferase [Candidatus Omnitrophota bacterium]
MRIGLLGGTFNPVHTGHLVLGEEAREKLNLDKVIFIPAYVPPHKKEDELADANDRFKMVELATRGNPYFEISSFEMDSKATSYSVETLKAFKSKYGETAKLFFITGADSLGELFSWKELDRIFKLSHFIVANRPGYEIANVPSGVDVVTITSLEISSSQIRRKVKEGKSIRYLVPEPVREYVIARRLYKSR